MPHMTVEYSANLEDDVNLQAFCKAMRDAMLETGIFPLAGIRIRAFPCHTYEIADGTSDYAYMHLICRVGHGRTEDVRLKAAEQLYDAAEAFLRPKIGTRPFALSLDFDELNSVTSLKRFNTLYDALKAKQS